MEAKGKRNLFAELNEGLDALAAEREGLRDWHAQAGTPLNVLQEMGGWQSYEMVLRYAHPSAVHLLPHASAFVLQVSGCSEL